MTPPIDMRLPDFLNADAVLACLDRVLDPELDESVLSLGFVESVFGDDGGQVTVGMNLPTYWCAANFSYLMASDACRELSSLEGVRSVTVKLGEHFVSTEVEEGTGLGKTFAEAFPEGGPDTLEETRQIFLRKGYFSRQERLLQALKQSGLSFQQISNLRIHDARSLQIEARTLGRYLERRDQLGLDCSAYASLIVDVRGLPVPADDLETYYVRARTTRLAMEASGSLCSAMLQSRNRNWTPALQPDQEESREGGKKRCTQ